jgi:putative tryptophan/tyrosine transport system substrate-binding protein
MKRREFILGLGGAAAAWPLAARAQQRGKVYRIGILEPIPAARNASNLDRLRKGLRDLGYLEGRGKAAILRFTMTSQRGRYFSMA